MAQKNQAPARRVEAQKKKPAAKYMPELLPPILTADGNRNYLLLGQIKKQYSSIELTDGKRTFVVHGAKPNKLGSDVVQIVEGLVMACYSGRGNSGEGAALWASNMHLTEASRNLVQMLEWEIVCIPSGRSGASGYRASIQDMLTVIEAKATIFRASLEEFPPNREVTSSSAEPEAEDVEFQFI